MLFIVSVQRCNVLSIGSLGMCTHEYVWVQCGCCVGVLHVLCVCVWVVRGAPAWYGVRLRCGGHALDVYVMCDGVFVARGIRLYLVFN